MIAWLCGGKKQKYDSLNKYGDEEKINLLTEVAYMKTTDKQISKHAEKCIGTPEFYDLKMGDPQEVDEKTHQNLP